MPTGGGQQPGAAETVTANRRYFPNFSKAAQLDPEVINETGTSKTGVYDAGETFLNAKRNGVWDADGGGDGQGGARDVVLIKYTTTTQGFSQWPVCLAGRKMSKWNPIPFSLTSPTASEPKTGLQTLSPAGPNK